MEVIKMAVRERRKEKGKEIIETGE